MNTDDTEYDENSGDPQETPLCLRCLRPVDPRAYYCPHCGEATGQLTPYIPFVNIPWEVRIWGQAWRQMWSRDVSIPGRLFRLLMIVWNVPIMLLGLIPRLWHKPARPGGRAAAEPDDRDSKDEV
jgi:hypothetical protein